MIDHQNAVVSLIVAILATWRIAAALYYEFGPWRVWLRMRQWANERSAFLSDQFNCFWCCTGIAALVVLPFYLWFPWPLYPVAFSGAAVLLTQGGRIVWREMTEHGQS